MKKQNNTVTVKTISPFGKTYPPSQEIQPLDFVEMSQKVGNLYKMMIILSKRAKQISQEMAEEIKQHLEYFNQISPYDSEREGHRNPEREKVFKEYEKRLKPTLQAIEEHIRGHLAYIEQNR
jgi:DNA-directed RNA polymerase subunit K/omega